MSSIESTILEPFVARVQCIGYRIRGIRAYRADIGYRGYKGYKGYKDLSSMYRGIRYKGYKDR